MSAGGCGESGAEPGRRCGETCERVEVVRCRGELCVFVVGQVEFGGLCVAHELVDRRGARDWRRCSAV